MSNFSPSCDWGIEAKRVLRIGNNCIQLKWNTSVVAFRCRFASDSVNSLFGLNGASCRGASVEDSDPSPAPSASVINPAVAGPDPSGSPAVGVCYEAARGGGGDLDVKEETLSSEEELLCACEVGGYQRAPVDPG